MIKINVSEVNEFLKATSQVVNNVLFPELQYCKFSSTGEIIRTNLNSWVIYKSGLEADDITEDILVDDRILRGFVAVLKDDDIITITIKDTKVFLKCGSREIGFQNMELSKFEKTPSQDFKGEKISVLSNVIKSIKIAQVYAMLVSQYEGPFSFIQLNGNDNEVFASNGNFIYVKRFDEQLPTMLLRHEACNILNDEKDYKYFEVGNYYFFDQDKFTFGFIKTESKTVDYRKIIDVGSTDIYFELNIIDVVNFCSLCASAAKELVPVASLSDSVLKYSDDSFNIKVEQTIVVGGNDTAEMSFNTIIVNRALRALPYERLKISLIEGGHYKLTTDEDLNYTGILSKVLK